MLEGILVNYIRKFFGIKLLVFILIFSIIKANLHATYVISSVDYLITPTAQTAKIGDYIFFRLAAIDVTKSYTDLTVATVTASALYLYSPSFPGSFPGFMYVYDGQRTWEITTYTPNPLNASQNTLMLENAVLKSGQNCNDYNTLQYSSFSVAEGNMLSGGVASIDIGTAIYGITLFDDGDVANHNDSVAGDGVYSTKFLVRESYQFNLKNAPVVGHFSISGTKASNDGFISPLRIAIDGIRPSIELVNASPNPFNPEKELLQLFYYLTENSTVTLNVFYNSVTVKTLNATGYYGYNQPILWDGLSNTGVMQTDGDFYYKFDIVDNAGNTGRSYVAPIKLTTVQIYTDIYSIDSQYSNVPVPSTVVRLKVNAELKNATKANLANLGFNYTAGEVPGISHDYRNYPWLYLDVRIYNNSGSLIETFPKDTTPNWEMDSFYKNTSSPQFGDGLSMAGNVYDYPDLPADLCSANTGTPYSSGDGDKGNDWDNVFGHPFSDGTYDDGIFTLDSEYVFTSSSIAPGTYIATVRGILVGKTLFPVYNESKSSYLWDQTVDCGGATKTVTYYKLHAMPSHFVDESYNNVIGDERGYGLCSTQRSASFIVESEPGIPLPDTTPPQIVNFSEYPSDNSIIEPNVLGPTNYLKVMITDDGVGAGPTNLSTFTLKDPYGNLVPGRVAWNAGNPGTKTWEVYYIPDNNLTVGGKYTYTVVPVDASYNIGAAKTFTFEIKDTSIPVVTNVSVQSPSGLTLELSPSTSTQVNFLVSKINASLISGGSAKVDWANSSIIVKDNSSGNTINGSVSHETGTNILSFTPNVVLSDGSYTVYITAVSANGYSGAYSYVFYITTAGVTYINLSGSGENSTTYMIISVFTETTSGITNALGNTISPKSITVTSVSSPPSPPATYAIIGTAISFTAQNLPLNFNSTLCSTILRMHYTNSDIAYLNNAGLKESDLTLWYYDGLSWNQLSGISNPITNGSDHYIQASISNLPAGNVYALMYVVPAAPIVIKKYTDDLRSDKAFNPEKGKATIYFYDKDGIYLENLSQAKEIKIQIYSLYGTLVRTIIYPKQASNFYDYTWTGGITPVNISYFLFDGKNDNGAKLFNGLYVMKIVIKKTDGSEVVKTRMIAINR